MALQKKVNKLQVEHVSEEEVDQVSSRARGRACAHTHIPTHSHTNLTLALKANALCTRAKAT